MALLAISTPDPFLDKDWYTEAEYFALEDRSPVRWEFLPDRSPQLQGPKVGRIRAMSGGTPNHSAIAGNLVTALNNALRGTGNRICRTFNSDLKIQTAEGRNTYPDASVVCGGLTLHQNRRDMVTNPILVAEVLSPSTENDDRGDKRVSYQTIPTLQYYLLLSAESVRVELYTHEESGWHVEAWEELDSQIALSALGITLALADLYAQVEFDGID